MEADVPASASKDASSTPTTPVKYGVCLAHGSPSSAVISDATDCSEFEEKEHSYSSFSYSEQ